MESFIFLVPVFNRIHCIERCILSLTSQTYRNFKVVIVDDCSTDGSYELLKTLCSRMVNVELLQNKSNLGIGATRNRLLQKAHDSDYIIFVDSDDWIEKELLEKLDEAICSNNQPDIIRYQNIVEPETVAQKEIERLMNPYRFGCEATPVITGEEALLKWTLGKEKLNTMPWTYCVKTEIYEGVYYPCVSVLEDFSVTPYLIAKSRTVMAIGYCGYHYMRSDNTLTKVGATGEDRIGHKKMKVKFLRTACQLAKQNINKTSISLKAKAIFEEDLREKLRYQENKLHKLIESSC